MIFVLEDNIDKYILTVDKFRAVFLGDYTTWVRSAQQAPKLFEDFIRTCESPPKVTFFLDNETLGPSTGLQFLEWLINAYRDVIASVVITTYSPEAKREMIKLCLQHDILHDTL